MEFDIIRLTLQRCLPEFKKEVTKKNRLYVGSLQEPQWNIYKQRLLESSNPPFVSVQSRNIPGLNDIKIKERVEMLMWSYYSHPWPAPILRGDPNWFFNKWIDESGRLWRSWLTDFSIIWDSHTNTVSIGFEYRVQHYLAYNKEWIYN
jgi:hypothetical protein